jgi:SAM-dependent methyltransferase
MCIAYNPAMPDPALRVQLNDAAYLKAAEAEAAFWDKPQFFSTEACAATPRGAPFDAYTNKRFTGDPAVPWFETLQRYGTFLDGLFFGCSAISHETRILELNPGLTCTFMDISSASLERRMAELGPRFARRVRTEQADLNFAALPASTYDVIVSSGTLHHLINIEHAAHQMSRALRPGGYLFLQDYVMEDRLQFSSERKAVFEALLSRGKDRGALPHSATAVWPAADDPTLSPFEAIRAEDTIAVLDATLDRVDLRGAGALNALLTFVRFDERDAAKYDSMSQHLWHPRPHSLRRRLSVALGRSRRPAMSRRFQDELLALDAVCIDSELLTPCNAFGVYRRRDEM